jgi:hypothetical protein
MRGRGNGASALHWSDLDAARAEFRRILREPGWLVALWNFRTSGDSVFGTDFDALWREVLGPPPAAGRDEIEAELVPELFGGSAFERYSFANPLCRTGDELVGLAASSSQRRRATVLPGGTSKGACDTCTASISAMGWCTYRTRRSCTAVVCLDEPEAHAEVGVLAEPGVRGVRLGG